MMSSILRLARTQSKRLPTTVSAPSRLLSTTTQRALAATPLRRAAPSWLPPLFSSAAYEALQLSSVFQKLKDNPDALAAVVRFSEVMQSQGIDISTGTPPSMLQMSKLFLKADVRDAAKDLADAFASAGLDLKDKKVMQELAELAKFSTGGGTPPKD